MVDSLKKQQKVLRKLTMGQNKPYPTVDYGWKGRIIIEGSKNRDVARVGVVTLGLVDHGKDSTSRVKV